MRRLRVQRYMELLAPLVKRGSIALPSMTPGHSWQTFMMTLSNSIPRDHLIRRLRARGVESNIGAQVLSTYSTYSDYVVSELTESLTLHTRSLALPLCEQYTNDTIEEVVTILNEIIIDLAV